MDNINRLQIQKQLSIEDSSNDHTYTFAVSELTLDRIITLPLLTGDDIFVFENHTQTLTNKTINSDSNTITNIVNIDIKADAAIDATKIADGTISNTEFQLLNGIASTVVGTSDSQILTNKTLTTPIIGTILNTGTITLPTSTDTLIGRNTTDTLTNKTINSDSNTITNVVNADIKVGAAIDVTKIANGTVSNTEFQYLNGTTSNIQTQINNSVSIFGTEYNYAEDDTLSTTESNSFVQKLRLTTSSIPLGTYRLTWYAEFSNMSGDRSTRVQLEQDDTTVLASAGSAGKLEGSVVPWHSFSGIKKLSSLSGIHTFDIDYSRGSSNTAQIKNARIELFRIS
jgi:hypothetical protein